MSSRALGEQFTTRRLGAGYYAVQHPENPNHANLVGTVLRNEMTGDWHVHPGWDENTLATFTSSKRDAVDALKDIHDDLVETGPDHPNYPDPVQVKMDAEQHEALRQAGIFRNIK